MKGELDAVVIGSGPNGLAAAITLARRGLSVRVYETSAQPGGGARSMELTRPGFVHDICSAIHPFGTLSSFFRELSLEKHGLEWITPEAAYAHPFEEGDPVVVSRSIEATAAHLGSDAHAYRELFKPLVEAWEQIEGGLLVPLSISSLSPKVARIGIRAITSARWFATRTFRTERVRAAYLGLACHSVLPLQSLGSNAIAMVLGATAHISGWPFPRGGAQKIADSLISYLSSLGGEIVTGERIKSVVQLPRSRFVFFDTSTHEVRRILGDTLPLRYRNRLSRFKYGPGVFKMDWALSAPIPWKDGACRKAATVHLGGSGFEMTESERTVWAGEHPKRPFVLLAQHSLFDQSRAPADNHTAWAYCHVPAYSKVDMSTAIESQIERFAPGFKDIILERSSKNTAELSQLNVNLVGGDITGGANTLSQLIARPVLSLSPYRLPIKGMYLCSASTPPGGGVHGLCGYYAALHAMTSF